MTLPFKLDAQPAGVRKAYAEMTKPASKGGYGKREGERIFLAKANERGEGRTVRQRVLSVYRKGATLS